MLPLPNFFYFNLSSPSGIATWTALQAICRFLRQYCSRRSNSDKYTLILYFWFFSSVFREILRGRGLFHVTGTCNHLCYIIWKGCLLPFVLALKGPVSNSCLQLAKGPLIAFRTIAKAIKSHLEQIECRICELHATTIVLAIYGTAGKT